MPRPKTISDEAILRIARRCFQERGHSVSTREIAKAVGISQSVLHQRFGGKEKMFLRAMMPEPPDIEGLLARPEGLGAEAYVHLISRRLVAHFRSVIPTLLHLLTYPHADLSLIERAHDHLGAQRLQRELAQRFDALVASGGLAAHAGSALAAAVIALAHTAGMQSAMDGSLRDIASDSASQELDLAPMVHVLWRGMAPRRATAQDRDEADGRAR